MLPVIAQSRRTASGRFRRPTRLGLNRLSFRSLPQVGWQAHCAYGSFLEGHSCTLGVLVHPCCGWGGPFVWSGHCECLG
jgi:hypothetical protein